MAWKDQHPNWLDKARFLGLDKDVIEKIRKGGTPGPRTQDAFARVKTRADGSVYDPTRPAPAGAPAPAPAGPAFNQGAYDLFRNMLAGWGIPMGADMEAIIQKAVVDGLGPQNIELVVPDLQNTDTWNKRFAGWKQRVANGYNQISVGEYLALENQYKRIMESAGMPVGFYDDHSDFGRFIAKNVSPDELQNRVQAAVTMANEVDPTARGLLTSFYGVGTGDIAAYFLDPNRALPSLDKQYKAVNVAKFAKRAGLDPVSATRFEDLVDRGVTEQQAAAGYSTVAQFTDTFGQLARIYGGTFDQNDAEEDVFFNNNEKRQKLMRREQAAFGGSSGSRGAPARSTAGSY